LKTKDILNVFAIANSKKVLNKTVNELEKELDTDGIAFNLNDIIEYATEHHLEI
jgi:hypothetical protein